MKNLPFLYLYKKIMNIIYGKFNILKKKKIFYYLIRLLTKIYRRKKERKGKKSTLRIAIFKSLMFIREE